MTQEEPKEDKAFDSIEQLSKIAQDLVRRKKELAQRTWVGLADEEIDAVTDSQWAKGVNKPIYAAHRAYARAIEAKLKERNT
jgi:hypothetical protein